MADMFFNSFREFLGDGTIDLDNDTFKVVLLSSSYTPDATDAVYADLSDELASSGGYTQKDKALTGVTWTRDGAVVTFDADNPSWTGATFTCRYAVILDETAANDPLVCLFDLGADKTVENGTFTLQFHTDGIFTQS
jgi:hypothetical protein